MRAITENLRITANINQGRLGGRLRRYGPLLFLWIGGLAAAFVLALGKAQDRSASEREAELKHVAQLSTSLRVGLESFSDKAANELARIIEMELTQGQTSSWLIQSPFQSAALVGENDNKSWKLEWSRSKLSASVNDQYQAWLPRLPLEKISGDYVSWNRVEVSGQRPSLLVGIQLRLKTDGKDKIRVALGQLPLDYLSSLTDPLKSDNGEIFLVDSAGYSLTFPQAQYVGSPMDVHPIVNLAVKTQGLSEYGDFRNLNGEPTVGGFERAKNSNVYVVTNLRVKTKTALVQNQFWQSGLIILGILILLSIPLWLLQESTMERLQQMRENLAVVKKSEASAGPISSNKYGPTISKDYFEKIGLSFFNQLKGPVYSALGKLQQIKTTEGLGENKNLQSNLDFLEKEMRRIRDFVEGLGRSLKVQDRSAEVLDLNTLVEGKLSQIRDQLQRRNIELEMHDHINAKVLCHSDDLQFMIETMLKRSASLLSESSEKRKLQVRIESAGPICRLSLLLHGVKLGASQVSALFDMTSPDELEMNFAKGYASAWNGQMFAESSLVGLRLFLELPHVPSQEPLIKSNPVVSAPSKSQAPEPPAYTMTAATLDLSSDSATQASIQSDPLSAKKIDEKLNKILPPNPTAKEKSPEVSVVDDLTSSSAKTEKSENSEVKIRRPKVRFDV